MLLYWKWEYWLQIVVVVVILFPTEYKQWRTEQMSNITTTINIDDPVGGHQRSSANPSHIWIKSKPFSYNWWIWRCRLPKMWRFYLDLHIQYSYFTRTSHEISVFVCVGVNVFVLLILENAFIAMQIVLLTVIVLWRIFKVFIQRSIFSVKWKLILWSVFFFWISISNSSIILNSPEIKLLLTNRRCLYI